MTFKIFASSGNRTGFPLSEDRPEVQKDPGSIGLFCSKFEKTFCGGKPVRMWFFVSRETKPNAPKFANFDVNEPCCGDVRNFNEIFPEKNFFAADGRRFVFPLALREKGRTGCVACERLKSSTVEAVLLEFSGMIF